MHLFKIIATDGVSLTVCAATNDAAAGLFVTWYLVTHGTSAPDFEVMQRNPDWPELNRAQLDEALAQGVAGIATYDPAQGWTITPLSLGEG